MRQDNHRYSHRGFVVEEGYATASRSDQAFFQAEVAEQMLLQQEQRWMDAILGGPAAPPAPQLNRQQIMDQILSGHKGLLTPTTPRGWIMHPATWAKMMQAYWPIKEGTTGLHPFFGVTDKLIYIDDATPIGDCAVIPHMHLEKFQGLLKEGRRPLEALIQCNLDFKKQHAKALARHRKKHRRAAVDSGPQQPFKKPRHPNARKGKRK